MLVYVIIRFIGYNHTIPLIPLHSSSRLLSKTPTGHMVTGVWNQWNGILEWNGGMEHWNGGMELQNSSFNDIA